MNLHNELIRDIIRDIRFSRRVIECPRKFDTAFTKVDVDAETRNLNQCMDNLRAQLAKRHAPAMNRYGCFN